MKNCQTCLGTGEEKVTENVYSLCKVCNGDGVDPTTAPVAKEQHDTNVALLDVANKVEGVEEAYSYEKTKLRNEQFKPIARRYETGKIGFYDALVESHNTAIENAVKVLNERLLCIKGLYSNTNDNRYRQRIDELTMQIELLNQLRK